jgi:hypothetical protein
MMSKTKVNTPAGNLLSAKDLADELERIACMGIEDLRGLWRSRYGQSPPEALTKDLSARALSHDLQEKALGGLSPKLRKRLMTIAAKGVVPARQMKIGSTILREHQGRVHQVVVVPDGFLWAGQTYASLSVIARKITGTRWNGLKFFGVGETLEEAQLQHAQKGQRCSSSGLIARDDVMQLPGASNKEELGS